VFNQPPEFENRNLFTSDPALMEAATRGAPTIDDRLREAGALYGSPRALQLSRDANRHKPVLHTHDAFGRRVDEVEYHPSYHELMSMWKSTGMESLPWTSDAPGMQTAHVAMNYMSYQIEAGSMCAATMTYACIPVLRNQPELAAIWEPKLTSTEYDPRNLPLDQKTSATIAMGLTEKQGGSDIRGSTTSAEPVGAGGPGEAYLLTGHKWFFSAPMGDGALILGLTPNQTELSCFLVPRWRQNGERNGIYLQRLKNKVGNHSNASSEVEFKDAEAFMVGPEGRGIRTLMDMVTYTRLDLAAWPAALMRRGVVLAIHHCRHRSAFQKRLVQQPMMANVLADLALESEAAMLMIMRIAQAFDNAATQESEARFARLAVAITKYWLNKRVVPHLHEAMECHGGQGYVEDMDIGRLYREAPMNGIGEGSGNVICMDVLRAIRRDPETLTSVFDEIDLARGLDKRFDAYVQQTKDLFHNGGMHDVIARELTERLATACQISLMLRFAPETSGSLFAANRMGDLRCFGNLMSGTQLDQIISRCWAP